MPDVFLGARVLNQDNVVVKPYYMVRALHYMAEQAALGNPVRLGKVEIGEVTQNNGNWDAYDYDFGDSGGKRNTIPEVTITYNTETQSLHFYCYDDNSWSESNQNGDYDVLSMGVFLQNGLCFALFPRYYSADQSSGGYGGDARYYYPRWNVPIVLDFDLPLADIPAASRDAIVAGLSATGGGGGGETPTATLEVVIPTAARSYIAAETAEERSVTIGYAKVGSGVWTPDGTAADLQMSIKTIADIHGANVGDDVIHVTIIDDSVDAYDVNEVGLYFPNGQLFAVASSSNYIIRKVSSTAIRIYFDISIADLGQAEITFGGVVLDNPPATTATQGVVRLADVTALENFEQSPLAVTAQGLHTLFWRQIINGGGWLTGTYKLPGGVVALFGQATVPAGNTGLKWYYPVGLKLSQVMCFCQGCAGNNGVGFMVTGWGRRYIRIKHNGNGIAKCYVLVIGI